MSIRPRRNSLGSIGMIYHPWHCLFLADDTFGIVAINGYSYALVYLDDMGADYNYFSILFGRLYLYFLAKQNWWGKVDWFLSIDLD